LTGSGEIFVSPVVAISRAENQTPCCHFLPADVLDMLVAADAQAEAALHATPLQHCPAIGGGHALAEAVHTYAPPDFWLICTLGHYLTPNNRIKTPNGGFTAGVFGVVPVLARDVDGWQL
jgi:hypothetical protein